MQKKSGDPGWDSRCFLFRRARVRTGTTAPFFKAALRLWKKSGDPSGIAGFLSFSHAGAFLSGTQRHYRNDAQTARKQVNAFLIATFSIKTVGVKPVCYHGGFCRAHTVPKFSAIVYFPPYRQTTVGKNINLTFWHPAPIASWPRQRRKAISVKRGKPQTGFPLFRVICKYHLFSTGWVHRKIPAYSYPSFRNLPPRYR